MTQLNGAREIDWRSPADAFAPIAGRKNAVLLHPGARAAAPGWSFIAAFPETVIEYRNGSTRVGGASSGVSPFEAARALHKERRRSENGAVNAPFATGLVGYVGYECAVLAEPCVELPASPYDLPDFSLGVYDACALFDHSCRRAYIAYRSRRAADRLEEALGRCAPERAPAPFAFGAPHASTPRDRYRRAVAEAIERIRGGEFFQANLSHRIESIACAPFNAFDLFIAASRLSSAEYGAFVQLGTGQILSLSPERFFSVRTTEGERRAIAAEPIKGTRPRGDTQDTDRRLLEELINDPKDRAENIMIADLTRNDLSRICADCSIEDTSICEPVSHEGVHHLVSRISGVLRPENGAIDALEALFPCGSITGAPKVQAMKAIAELEGAGRGPYCGAIGYIDDRGGADFSVAIRIAVVQENTIVIPVGGGVTLRSDPEKEYQETLTKARGWLAATGTGDMAIA
ncbi:MAG: anthranilate synthase component I family protein [Parvularculaceae bacterium]